MNTVRMILCGNVEGSRMNPSEKVGALQRKKAVKTGTASPKEFTDWLYQQSNVIVELTEI